MFWGPRERSLWDYWQYYQHHALGLGNPSPHGDVLSHIITYDGTLEHMSTVLRMYFLDLILISFFSSFSVVAIPSVFCDHLMELNPPSDARHAPHLPSLPVPPRLPIVPSCPAPPLVSPHPIPLHTWLVCHVTHCLLSFWFCTMSHRNLVEQQMYIVDTASH